MPRRLSSESGDAAQDGDTVVPTHDMPLGTHYQMYVHEDCEIEFKPSPRKSTKKGSGFGTSMLNPLATRKTGALTS